MKTKAEKIGEIVGKVTVNLLVVFLLWYVIMPFLWNNTLVPLFDFVSITGWQGVGLYLILILIKVALSSKMFK